MESSLENAMRRRIVFVASLAISAVLVFQAGKIWLANHRLDSAQIATMERGAALIPGDGSAWDRLGRMRQWDFVNSDLPGAIEDYWKAVSNDPRSAHFWMDLASAYEASGDNARARDAYVHAKAVYPASAEVAFHFGNYLLREEEYSAAFAELKRAVYSDPSLLPLAISRTWRSSEDIDALLNGVLPANTEAYLQALDFFASIHQAQPGLAVWQRLVGLGKPFPLARVFPFFEELIRQDRSNEASGAWRAALAAAGLPHDEPKNQNLAWNGDFAQDFANGGLDWRWMPLLDVEMSVDPEPAPNGSRAIRLYFNGGANISLAAPAQFVAVEPSHRYHFHAFMRTEAITTESGTRFYLIDPNHNDALSVQTENMTGSHAWTPAETDFETGPETHFVKVELARPPSRLFENKLEGTVWIADVSVTRLSAPSGQPLP
jgi:tetratricopeptide (TPR) repeat protein